ncbi:MAG: hydrolase Nlp/P60, partial [Eudoraea sp.]
MHHGICHLSIVPVRLQAEDTEPMLTQLLYGDYFKIIEKRKFWSKIRDGYDKSEGWIRNDQFTIISKESYNELKNKGMYVSDLVSFVSKEKGELLPVVKGSYLA